MTRENLQCPFDYCKQYIFSTEYALYAHIRQRHDDYEKSKKIAELISKEQEQEEKEKSIVCKKAIKENNVRVFMTHAHSECEKGVIPISKIQNKIRWLNRHRPNEDDDCRIYTQNNEIDVAIAQLKDLLK